MNIFFGMVYKFFKNYLVCVVIDIGIIGMGYVFLMLEEFWIN